MQDSLNHFLNEWGAAFGITGLMLFMGFIIWDLAKKHNAGKFGTFILFIGLGAGMMGFIIKIVIQFALERNMV